MKLTPDYVVTSHELFDAVRLLDRESAVRLIAAQLGAAFASGGIKALDMVKEGIEKL